MQAGALCSRRAADLERERADLKDIAKQLEVKVQGFGHRIMLLCAMVWQRVSAGVRADLKAAVAEWHNAYTHSAQVAKMEVELLRLREELAALQSDHSRLLLKKHALEDAAIKQAADQALLQKQVREVTEKEASLHELVTSLETECRMSAQMHQKVRQLLGLVWILYFRTNLLRSHEQLQAAVLRWHCATQTVTLDDSNGLKVDALKALEKDVHHSIFLSEHDEHALHKGDAAPPVLQGHSSSLLSRKSQGRGLPSHWFEKSPLKAMEQGLKLTLLDSEHDSPSANGNSPAQSHFAVPRKNISTMSNSDSQLATSRSCARGSRITRSDLESLFETRK